VSAGVALQVGVDAKEGPFDCERERKLSDVVP
jgi:hypothetical protein